MDFIRYQKYSELVKTRVKGSSHWHLVTCGTGNFILIWTPFAVSWRIVDTQRCDSACHKERHLK